MSAAAALAATGFAGPLQVALGGVSAATLAHALTAAVGLFVAYQAFRGFRRNESRPMLFLAVGLFFLTTVGFVVSTLLVTATGASDAVAALTWTVAEIVGLAAVLYALTGA
jgi:ABC-type transporter Mla maintaining outer membrane lipid asymmetry permease subunit MlaE